MSKARLQLAAIVKRIEKSVNDNLTNEVLGELGLKAVEIVRKRTRLGYGVTKQFGERGKLAPLSPNYVEQRRMFNQLAAYTTPKKSNLTRTGQMLESLGVTVKGTTVIIRPEGVRTDGKRNEDVARWNQEGAVGQRKDGSLWVRPERIFLNISGNEYNQLLRFYRKTFGDLLRKRKVI
jgi:hypothetical protein